MYLKSTISTSLFAYKSIDLILLPFEITSILPRLSPFLIGAETSFFTFYLYDKLSFPLGTIIFNSAL